MVKRKRHFSDSIFWAKHISLALALIVIAGIVIFLQNENATAPQAQGADGPKSLAENMTDFYAEFRLSSRHPREEELGDFVMEVKPADKPLGERLKAMESIQNPVSSSWAGDYKYRTFKPGSTLRSAITDYAQSEGMQVIWELDQDFIVKHQFQLNDTIVGSLRSIGGAIDSNFNGGVRTFVCPKQRSLVITNKKSDYVQENCSEVN